MYIYIYIYIYVYVCLCVCVKDAKILFHFSVLKSEISQYGISFSVHYRQPSHFDRKSDGISVCTNFFSVPKEIMYVFPNVLDDIRGWFLYGH